MITAIMFGALGEHNPLLSDDCPCGVALKKMILVHHVLPTLANSFPWGPTAWYTAIRYNCKIC